MPWREVKKIPPYHMAGIHYCLQNRIFGPVADVFAAWVAGPGRNSYSDGTTIDQVFPWLVELNKPNAEAATDSILLEHLRKNGD